MTVALEHDVGMENRRERQRAATVSEIKDLARLQLAAQGVGGLSLRAIARDLGVVSSAVYRYFPGRDALLTALIADAYGEYGASVEVIDTACPREDLAGRWLAFATGTRHWAGEHPHDWALVYGSPVPGYAAPPEVTLRPARRSTDVLSRLLVDVAAAGRGASLAEPQDPALRSRLSAYLVEEELTVPLGLFAAGLSAWAVVLGLVSFEVFGHLAPVLPDAGALFELQVRTQGAWIIAP